MLGRQDHHMCSVGIIVKDHVWVSRRRSVDRGLGGGGGVQGRTRDRSRLWRIRNSFVGGGVTSSVHCVFAKVTNKLLLINPVDVFDLLGLPTVSVTADHFFLFEILSSFGFCDTTFSFSSHLSFSGSLSACFLKLVKPQFYLRPCFHVILHTLSGWSLSAPIISVTKWFSSPDRSFPLSSPLHTDGPPTA